MLRDSKPVLPRAESAKTAISRCFHTGWPRCRLSSPPKDQPGFSAKRSFDGGIVSNVWHWTAGAVCSFQQVEIDRFGQKLFRRCRSSWPQAVTIMNDKFGNRDWSSDRVHRPSGITVVVEVVRAAQT